MKVRFTESPKGRPELKKGAVVEFKGKIEEGYARKYITRGWATEVDEAAERVERQKIAEEERAANKRAARAAVVIPDKYAELPPAELRTLATQLTDETVKGKDDAIAVITAELALRAA